MGVPDNQILLHFSVSDNQILLSFGVPNNQILLHFDVPDNWEILVGMVIRVTPGHWKFRIAICTNLKYLKKNYWDNM